MRVLRAVGARELSKKVTDLQDLSVKYTDVNVKKNMSLTLLNISSVPL